MEQLCPPHRLNFFYSRQTLPSWCGMGWPYIVIFTLSKGSHKSLLGKNTSNFDTLSKESTVRNVENKKKNTSSLVGWQQGEHLKTVVLKKQSVCACVVGICIYLCRPVLRDFAVIFLIIILQYENYLKIWFKTQIIFCKTWRTTEK